MVGTLPAAFTSFWPHRERPSHIHSWLQLLNNLRRCRYTRLPVRTARQGVSIPWQAGNNSSVPTVRSIGHCKALHSARIGALAEARVNICWPIQQARKSYALLVAYLACIHLGILLIYFRPHQVATTGLHLEDNPESIENRFELRI